MYAHCLFCHAALGRNAALEAFPVGRRLAFDAAKGRLWVVCPRCERWNLTPLAERWEAIEAAERLYQDTRRRVSTANVGLARLGDGTALVRIGRPERPEFAAWRYGDQFGRRRRRRVLVGGALLAGGALVVGGGLAAGIGVVTTAKLGHVAYKVAQHGWPSRVVARVAGPAGEPIEVRRRDLTRTRFERGDDGLPALALHHDGGVVRLDGELARRAVAALFPVVNRGGGSPDEVRRAVERIERFGDAERFYRSLAERGPRLTRVSSGAPVRVSLRERVVEHAMTGGGFDDGTANWASGLLAMSTPLSLAIEMAVHEEQERRAMEGELAALERAWRAAEEVAAIADDLLLPDAVRGALRRLRGEGPTG